MKKIDNETRYAIISIFLFILVFAVAFSGSLQAFKIATEIKKEKQTASAKMAYSPFGVKPVKPSPYSDSSSLNGKSGNFSSTGKSSSAPLAINAQISNKNWCSTTYVTVTQNADKPLVRDCRIGNNPIEKAIEELYSCILENSGLSSEQFISKLRLYNLLCMSPAGKEQILKEAFGGTNSAEYKKLLSIKSKLSKNETLSTEERNYLNSIHEKGHGDDYAIDKKLKELSGDFVKDNKLKIPKACSAELEKVQKAKKAYLSKVEKEADKDDLASCSFKGVANCVLSSKEAAAAISKLQACKGYGGGAYSIDCENAIKNSDKIKGKYLCSPKNKTPGGSGSSGSASSGGQGGISTPYTGGGNIRPSYGNYGNYAQNPYMQNPNQNIQNQNNKNYDPCKDPTYTEKQNMGFFSSLMFNVNCALTSKNNGKDSDKKNEKQDIVPSCVLSFDKDSIKSGEKITIKWKTSNAVSATLKDSGGQIASGTSGQITVYPSESQSYTLTAKSKNGKTKTCTKSVTVSDNPVKLSCSPDVVEGGSSVQIDWSCPAGYSLESSNFDANGDSGSLAKTVSESTDFTLTCVKDAEVLEASCHVQVANPQFEIIAYPLQVKRDEKARVSWASVYMNSCNVKGPRGFDYSRNYAVVLTTPFPSEDRIYDDTATYTITCTGKWGKEYSKDVSIKLIGDLDKPEEPKEEPVQPSDEVTTVIKTSLDPKQCPHFTRYHKMGESGGEIPKIQIFLKDQKLYFGPIDGYYSAAVDEAVREFQARYADEILKPWGLSAPTGYWYKTTRKKANYLAGCAEGAVVLDDGTVVY